MIGGMYRLKQEDSVYYTLFDKEKDRYIIYEESQKLARYYILATNSQSEDFNSTVLYSLVHYVLPTSSDKIESRSIDKDVKEFFAMKNYAHFTYEQECFGAFMNDYTKRTAN